MARVAFLGDQLLPATIEQFAMREDRPREIRRGVLQQARLQVRDEHPELARTRAPRTATGAGEAIPGAREGQEVGAPAAAVRGEHRADAAFAVDIRADDDWLPVAYAVEHRLARTHRQAVDRAAQLLDQPSAAAGAMGMDGVQSHKL